MHGPILLNLLVFAIATAAFDRISGWGANGLKRIALAGALAAVFWWRAGEAGLLLAAGAYVWRSRPFGRLLAAFREDFVRAVARHLWALACVPGVVATTPYWPQAWGGFDPPTWLAALSTIPPLVWLAASAPFAVFAVWAALLSRWNRIAANRGEDINAHVELIRGGSVGLAILVAVALVGSV